jgi:hypothetical protein
VDLSGPFAKSANALISTPAASPRLLNRGQKRALAVLGWLKTSPTALKFWNVRASEGIKIAPVNRPKRLVIFPATSKRGSPPEPGDAIAAYVASPRSRDLVSRLAGLEKTILPLERRKERMPGGKESGLVQ